MDSKPSSTVVIAGTGEARYKRSRGEGSAVTLIAEACELALENAQIERNAVDGFALSSFSVTPDHALDVAWQLGLSPRWLMEEPHGGASALNALQHAARAVEAGDAEVVLVAAGDQFSAGEFSTLTASFNATTRDYLEPLGFGGPNTLFAMLMERHQQAHGLEALDYGRVAVAQRGWAAKNPGAVYRQPLSLEEYAAAPEVASPLRRYDCAPVVSGADALIVCARKDAKQGTPVEIRAIRNSFNDDSQEGDGLTTALAELAPDLWADGGVSPSDVDVISVYDDYTVMVLVQLADLGFVDGQDLDSFVRSVFEERPTPINTSGGQLSAGQAGIAGSLHGLVEAVRQLRGECSGRQVPDARIALVTGYGMLLYRYCAAVNAAVLEASR